ncbi:vacuolar protein sorting 18 [Strigomonas culicis]|uniref:Vacuolar protein sorting 18 n=1 Tax=Strigomonas culicis TaxID=28005 RepID=S9VWF9_9TRYP|nr:vacuolar protein sorting 18 [Strigomonas culicis]|eukprot:EPY31401.1 vacuolar protein sorting 18 [Strigomonas culicis]
MSLVRFFKRHILQSIKDFMALQNTVSRGIKDAVADAFIIHKDLAYIQNKPIFIDSTNRPPHHSSNAFCVVCRQTLFTRPFICFLNCAHCFHHMCYQLKLQELMAQTSSTDTNSNNHNVNEDACLLCSRGCLLMQLQSDLSFHMRNDSKEGPPIRLPL